MGPRYFNLLYGKEYIANSYFGIAGGGDMPNSKPRTNFLHRADESLMIEKIPSSPSPSGNSTPGDRSLPL
jgi:hypothetical protein